jgi:hypothetical protein
LRARGGWPPSDFACRKGGNSQDGSFSNRPSTTQNRVTPAKNLVTNHFLGTQNRHRAGDASLAVAPIAETMESRGPSRPALGEVHAEAKRQSL